MQPASLMPAVKRPRLPFLDWTRGLAAVIMLQGHTFHAFVRNDLRNDGPYIYSQFVGGLPPAIFLFLTGITFAFSMERSDRFSRGWGWRWIQAMKRARYLFLLAFVFRFQLWLFSGARAASWTDLLKVDILNCMGVTMFVVAPLAILDKYYRSRVAALIGFAIAFASPLISLGHWDWLPWPLRNYIVPNFDFFTMFPWAAFLAFGIAAGTVLKSVTADQMNRLMQWTTIIGFSFVFGGQYVSNLPFSVYVASEFWLNSPWLVLMKLGLVLMISGGAYLWTEHIVHERWSWVKQLGTTSLAVYWIHIELVYGRWFGAWKEQLNNYQCATFALLLTVAMLAVSIMRTRWREFPWPQWVPVPPPARPRRVAGD